MAYYGVSSLLPDGNYDRKALDECLPVSRVGMRPVFAMLNDGLLMAFALDETADNRYCS